MRARRPLCTISHNLPPSPTSSRLLTPSHAFSQVRELADLFARRMTELAPQGMSHAQQLFKLMDTDGNGHIVFSELQRMVSKRPAAAHVPSLARPGPWPWPLHTPPRSLTTPRAAPVLSSTLAAPP